MMPARSDKTLLAHGSSKGSYSLIGRMNQTHSSGFMAFVRLYVFFNVSFPVADGSDKRVLAKPFSGERNQLAKPQSFVAN
jgi:hypothetical protein